MAQLKINIPIDPIKLSKEKLSDNWTFVTALYRYLAHSHEEHHSVVSSKEEKASSFPYFPQIIAPNSQQLGKRSIDQVYPDHFYQGITRQPFFHMENTMQSKTYFNSGKHSVGKVYKENSMGPGQTSPNKGKWSVNSLMFQNNLMPIIDRIK